MEAVKRRLSNASAEHREHDAENRNARRMSADAAMAQHREDDDRAEEAKGRNADEMDSKYVQRIG